MAWLVLLAHHFGGAIQVTLSLLIGEGASVAVAASAALIVGARHMLYSVTLAPKLRINRVGFGGSVLRADYQVFVLNKSNRLMNPSRSAVLSLGGFHVLGTVDDLYCARIVGARDPA